MSCKKCKKNASGIVKALKNKFKGVKNEPKEKTPCETKRKVEQDWLSDSVKGKKLSKMAKATNPQNIILTVFAWIPLTVGYVTIIRFVINLF